MCTESDGARDRIWFGDGHRLVDRDRETLAAGGQPEVHRRRRGHADHLAGAVDHRATGVARAHRRATSIRPVSSSELPVSASFGVDGPVEAGHGAHLTGQRRRRFRALPSATTGSPIGDLCGVAERRGRQTARAAQLEHGDVVSAVIADQIGTERPAGDRCVDPVGALHHVEVRQHLAAGVEHEAGADTDRVLVVDRGVDLDDGRLHPAAARADPAGAAADVAGHIGATSAMTAASAISSATSPRSGPYGICAGTHYIVAMRMHPVST